MQKHFELGASSFDELYGDEQNEEALHQRLLRPGLFRRREFAVSVVESFASPRVLDVGCGSGRIAEHALEAGASGYVGVDFSQPMLDLAEHRLARFGEKVSLVQGDFLTVPLDGTFDVILALGFFDYQPDATGFVRRMRELCSGSAVASFPRWNWVKGPIRKLRYEVINNCPIFDYTEDGLRSLFAESGFSRVRGLRSRDGFVVRADV